MLVEDLEDERDQENEVPIPIPPIICVATPCPPVLWELIPIGNPAPLVPGVKVEGEDDVWYIPPVMHHQIHTLDEYTTSQVEPVLEYVKESSEDPIAGPPRYDLAADSSEDELWVNLGVETQCVD